MPGRAGNIGQYTFSITKGAIWEELRVTRTYLLRLREGAFDTFLVVGFWILNFHRDVLISIEVILWRAVQWQPSVQDGDRRTQLGSAPGLVWTCFGNSATPSNCQDNLKRDMTENFLTWIFPHMNISMTAKNPIDVNYPNKCITKQKTFPYNFTGIMCAL